ncbi:MAG TPA: VOC family protein [Solirubrobacteraceae bacterium]
MPTTTSRLSEISLVAVPSPKQDEAISFYESLGFEKRTDVPFGDQYRWVEVYPSSGSTGLALAPPPPGGQSAVDTGVVLPTDDIDATHAEMKTAGIDVDEEISRMGDPVPPMFWFRDPNGNRLLIVQRQG